MDKLRLCHYCGGEPRQHTNEDINYQGEKGFKSIVRCTLCKLFVETWAEEKNTAEERAARYWNGDGKE